MKNKMSVFNKIFKSYSEKEVKRVMPLVEKINGLEEEIFERVCNLKVIGNIKQNFIE